MKKNNKKYILITGLSGGIGEKISAEFQNKGYLVIGIDKTMPKIYDYFYEFDLENISFKEKVNELFKKIDNILQDGNLEAVINNAAFQIKKPIDSLEIEDFEKSLRINFLSPFIIGKHYSQSLTNSKGILINILSIHTELTKRNFAAYSSSKSALASLTRTFAIEYGSKFSTIGVSPGAIETTMLKDGFKGLEDKYAELKNLHPSGKIGKPKHIAKLVYFLVSEKIDFLNGSIIDISGGIKNYLRDPD